MIEKKVSGLADWATISVHVNSIEDYIRKMMQYKKDYTQDIQIELNDIIDIFAEARERAVNAIIAEADKEEA
jgi:hypothetical protein